MDESSSHANGPSMGPAHRPEHAKTNDPCCHGPIDKEKRRNLVISIDGTSNKFGAMNTNVIEHHSLLIKDERQIPYYNSGIGTYARPSWLSPKFIGMVLHHKIDLAIAWDFDKTVKDAYRWISENYETGDLIFMFGFSRGAFQVRVLSAMIEKVGLLHRGNELQIPFAYELYCDPATDELEPIASQKSRRERVTVAERFKRTFSRKEDLLSGSGPNARLTFLLLASATDVGVSSTLAPPPDPTEKEDTVSSIGTVRGAKMLPGTIDGMKHVCFFRHALALDERRVKFLPEYAHGGKGPDQEATSGDIPHTKEVWFAGTHSDIGGGNTLNPSLDRTRPPLRWMVYEAGPLGLRTSSFERELDDEEMVDVKESLTGVWWPFEYLPLRRLTYTRKEKKKEAKQWPWPFQRLTPKPEEPGKETTHALHRGKVRKIHPGQKIHISVVSSNHYSPKASAPPSNPGDNGDFWGSLRKVARSALNERGELYDRWVQPDLVNQIRLELDLLLKKPGHTSDSFITLLQRDEGLRAFYGAVLAKLGEDSLDQDGKSRLIKECSSILGSKELESAYRRSRNPRIEYRDFLNRLSPFFQTYPKLDSDSWPYSVAFSPDGKWLVSGHIDGTVRTWDSPNIGDQTGKVLGQHSIAVSSVAFSPLDSKHFVSGSFDNTIRLWDIEKMEQVGDPWEGHTNGVNYVAFSPDGKKVVSASDDRTVRLWDPETGKEIAVLKGHANLVLAVAFSPDGLHIASGSSDQTVCIWDACTYQQVGGPLKGHTHWIWSVAYSPNGKQIASGSLDKMIHLWDADTMVQVGEPLLGHSSSIRSVCFSPDGKLLASGSDDCTIRIWNANTGARIGEGLCGHSNWVRSVAFSPDGKQLASASDDGTIRIWDMESYVYLHSIGSDL
ncbi:hypothetical protein D9613_011530 [Agrocybe pediades]|uniref:DUF2235 domain-containing protein n=1 Tax=Agrocybe pediades TaxID=84607 RepID=A0A8H4QVD7_9AGAR|nr:hypothetical protein D9613_011530 [Agrocybe pediades]